MHFATKSELVDYISANQDLEYLVIDGFDGLADLEELTELPPGLINLFISHCANLRRVLTTGITEVWIGDCANFVEIRADRRLKSLSLYRLASMPEPSGLPDSLERLRIERCPSITALSTLPSSLSDLTLVDNQHLRYLAPRSTSVFTVVDGCPELFRSK